MAYSTGSNTLLTGIVGDDDLHAFLETTSAVNHKTGVAAVVSHMPGVENMPPRYEQSNIMPIVQSPASSPRKQRPLHTPQPQPQAPQAPSPSRQILSATHSSSPARRVALGGLPSSTHTSVQATHEPMEMCTPLRRNSPLSIKSHSRSPSSVSPSRVSSHGVESASIPLTTVQRSANKAKLSFREEAGTLPFDGNAALHSAH